MDPLIYTIIRVTPAELTHRVIGWHQSLKQRPGNINIVPPTMLEYLWLAICKQNYDHDPALWDLSPEKRLKYLKAKVQPYYN